MLGETIKQLRTDKGLTQKELAEQLFVTPQAVSRWENGEVEPSVGTLSLLAKIFGVSVSALVGEEVAVAQAAAPAKEAPVQAAPVQEKLVEPAKPIAVPQPQKPVLAVCESCNKPIYDGADIVREHIGRTGARVLCRACDKKQKEAKKSAAIAYSAGQRTKSYVWSGIITALLLLFSITGSGKWFAPEDTLLFCGISILFFPFISCLFLKNNFIGEMFLTIVEWSFVKFPGLIFELSLDGILWLLTVKLAFWLIGIILGILCTLLALALCLIVSLFVYPFALIKSFRRPEETETI